MKPHDVAFTPEAEEQLAELYRYIEEKRRGCGTALYERGHRVLRGIGYISNICHIDRSRTSVPERQKHNREQELEFQFLP